jgi:hypothetical protein
MNEHQPARHAASAEPRQTGRVHERCALPVVVLGVKRSAQKSAPWSCLSRGEGRVRRLRSRLRKSEHTAHGRRVPLCTAPRGGHPGRVQVRGDLAKRFTAGAGRLPAPSTARRYAGWTNSRRDICIDCGRVLDPDVDDVLVEQTWWESGDPTEQLGVTETGRLLCEQCSWLRTRREEQDA